MHPVTVGRTAGGRAEILGGLRAGEQVVVDRAFTIKSAILSCLRSAKIDGRFTIHGMRRTFVDLARCARVDGVETL